MRLILSVVRRELNSKTIWKSGTFEIENLDVCSGDSGSKAAVHVTDVNCPSGDTAYPPAAGKTLSLWLGPLRSVTGRGF